MKFKLGDRVAVYNAGIRHVGIVDEVFPVVNRLRISGDATDWQGWHVKQCRKIKPKKPLRVIWVNEYNQTGLNQAVHNSKDLADIKAVSGRIRCVRFREWPEGKK